MQSNKLKICQNFSDKSTKFVVKKNGLGDCQAMKKNEAGNVRSSGPSKKKRGQY